MPISRRFAGFVCAIICVAVYNEEEYLGNSVDSVLNQSFKDFEIIIIDDHSTDASLEVMKKYSELDDRVVILRTPWNSGPADARNVGLKKARGKYVAILDADDVNMPGRLETQYVYMEKNRNIYLSGGDLVLINDDNKEVDAWKSRAYGYRDVEKILQARNCIAHSSVMFRNTGEFFYREKFEVSEEYDLYLNILSAGKQLVNIPEYLVKYRLREQSLPFRHSAKIHIYAEKAREFYGQRLRGTADQYEHFRPENMSVEAFDDIGLSSQVNLALKMKNPALASYYLREYRKDRGSTWKKYLRLMARVEMCRLKKTQLTLPWIVNRLRTSIFGSRSD